MPKTGHVSFQQRSKNTYTDAQTCKRTQDITISKKSEHRHSKDTTQKKSIFYLYDNFFYLLSIFFIYIYFFTLLYFYFYLLRKLEMVAMIAGGSINLTVRGSINSANIG